MTWLDTRKTHNAAGDTVFYVLGLDHMDVREAIDAAMQKEERKRKRVPTAPSRRES